ncbi:hypothetical protein [Novosphingobium pokkalii]|uniref:Uncharacterized protein n=1 Tax=Novosphingobium pokkalii TaxID=1770194 RepID=A0ABV7V8E2_9SPHN|nr:hypothetical protein [Novosphingobium pokkalii]
MSKRGSFSAADGRNLAWEDILPELAQGVNVSKSAAADLPAGGFGGAGVRLSNRYYKYLSNTYAESQADLLPQFIPQNRE